jgi:hypothetical protein
MRLEKLPFSLKRLLVLGWSIPRQVADFVVEIIITMGQVLEREDCFGGAGTRKISD